jgi:mRNA interferase HicA
MKQRDLIKELKNLGWWKLREGGNHEIWTNGTIEEQIPRHREINENLARKILKTAKTGRRKQ